MFLVSTFLTRKQFYSTAINLSARKYMRSLSQTALHYKPAQIKTFDEESRITDRVVQTFFDSTTYRIQVFEAQNRIQEIGETSTPSHSFYQVTLPFSTNQQLRKKMTQFFNEHVRIGRVLELMDYIAANVAYRYCSSAKDDPATMMDKLPFSTVTASIDQIDFFHPIDVTVDCSFSGYVSYVGRSTMEIQIDVMQKIQDHDRLACSAKFVMAARDKKTGKAYVVPNLDISGEPEHFRIKNQLGIKRQKLRKTEASKALVVSPPTYEESSKVHSLMLQIMNSQSVNGPISWIPMSQTIQRNTLLMHLQDKNLSGKIFGGNILRLAYELAWVTAFKFLKGKFPKCTHIDDVQFLAPVQIGTIMELEAVISYISEEILHVIVECQNSKGSGETKTTNILRISFQYSGQIGQVYPHSLKQMNQYIESMRRVTKYLQN